MLDQSYERDKSILLILRNFNYLTEVGPHQIAMDGAILRQSRRPTPLAMRRQSPIAALTLAGVKGTDLSRTPVASKTALLIAAGTTAAEGSPEPQGGWFHDP
jgi:hypothetical protein